ncbi:hypothetical protein [Erwinia amylovora]|uniref:hypothetical protein n=1 Tax=Erwinia amylovora TaxID=552 RepID=UPI000C081C45|nr:hypothetical protein [Erwinia amylovora]
MKTIQIGDALCRVEQAQMLLSVWMEADIGDEATMTLIGALMIQLKGVPEAIAAAETEICDYIMRDRREAKA